MVWQVPGYTLTDPSGRCLVCVVAGGAVGAAAGFAGTYFSDVGGNLHSFNDVLNFNTYVPHSSWQTYAENTITGGVVGATCSVAFVEAGFACYTIGTGVACAGAQFLFDGNVDVPGCLGQAAIAGGAQVASGLFFPAKVPGRYPVLGSSAFFFGKHAIRYYEDALIDVTTGFVAERIWDRLATTPAFPSDGKE